MSFGKSLATAIMLGLAAMVAPASAQQPGYLFDDPNITEPPRANHKTLKPPGWPAGVKGRAGATHIVACVDPTGQLYGPLLVDSSGVKALDDRFLAWAMETRWLPGKVGDHPVSVCGWPVTWVWQGPHLKPPRLPYSAAANLKLDIAPALAPDTPPPVRPERETPGAYADSGKQELEVCVGPDGRVEQVTITTGLHNQGLNDAIRTWAKGLNFTPAIRRGQPAGVCGVKITYTWPKPTLG